MTVRRQYVLDVADGYAGWHQACWAVSDAYDNWKRASRQHQYLAFCEYIAALNCEEDAASAYREAVERLAALTSTSGPAW